MKLRHGKALFGAFCLSLANVGPCLGVDYTFDANTTLQQNYNTNILLSPRALDPQPVWGVGLDARAVFSAKAPEWEAAANARFDNWFYGPASGLDMQNQYVDARYTHLTERSRYELAGNFTSDALLSSTLSPINNQAQGIVFGRIQRELKTLSPSWTYSLSEYTKINLRYSYNNSKYPSASGSGNLQGSVYPDSTTHSASASANHLATEQLTLNGVVSATSFTTRQTTIHYLNFSAGLQYAFTPDTELELSGGVQYSQSTIGLTRFGQSLSQTSEQFSPLVELSLTKKFQYSTLALSYSHQSSPSINSNLFTSDWLSVTAKHEITARFDAKLRLSYYNTSTPNQNGTALSQSSYQFGGDVSYKLAENTLISASYNYQFRDLGAGSGLYSGIQDAHILSLNLRYDFGKAHY